MVNSGTLVSIFGCGVLLQGEAGIGKSELALGLVDRGHCLIADDAPEYSLGRSGEVTGAVHAEFSGFVEVRGVGVINVARLYGARAIQYSTRLDLILRLEHTNCHDHDRVMGRSGTEYICGQPVPWRCLPVAPGRNLPLLAETLVRIQQLSWQGYDAGADFLEKLNVTMRKGAA